MKKKVLVAMICAASLYSSEFKGSYENLANLDESERGHITTLEITEEVSEIERPKVWDTIGHMTNLEYLSFNDNRMSGEIPAALGNLTNLQSLSFRNNRMSGEIPAELSELTNLEYLFLSGNIDLNYPSAFYLVSRLKMLRFNDFLSDKANEVINSAEVDNNILTFNLKALRLNLDEILKKRCFGDDVQDISTISDVILRGVTPGHQVIVQGKGVSLHYSQQDNDSWRWTISKTDANSPHKNLFEDMLRSLSVFSKKH